MKLIYNNYLYESITPLKPNKVLTKNQIINGGTSIAHKQYYKEFTTKKGNVVKIIFGKSNADDLSIDFAVNGAYNVSNREQDPEILRGVLYVATKYVKQQNPNILTFAFNDDDDKAQSRYNVFKKMILNAFPEYKEYFSFGYNTIGLIKK